MYILLTGTRTPVSPWNVHNIYLWSICELSELNKCIVYPFFCANEKVVFSLVSAQGGLEALPIMHCE